MNCDDVKEVSKITAMSLGVITVVLVFIVLLCCGMFALFPDEKEKHQRDCEARGGRWLVTGYLPDGAVYECRE